MISMMLGLIVVGAVVSVMVANKRSYRSNEALSQVQESARTAFEILARDARQAGDGGCDNSGRIANVLQDITPLWWESWFGIKGFDGSATDSAVTTGTAPGQRVTGTDSIRLQSIESAGLSVKTHDTTNAKITLNAASSTLAAGDIVMVCDFDHEAIFSVSSYDTTNVAISHADFTAPAGTPGNCARGLGYPTDCSSSAGSTYAFSPNAQVSRFTAVDYYIGNNGRATESGRSLYRHRVIPGGTEQAEEVVAGVTDMQIQYRVSGTDTFVDAGSVTAANWANVNALAVTITAMSADQRVSSDASVNSGRLQRSFTWLVTLRNRVP
jgi:type IV pilus assembly protein PilW